MISVQLNKANFEYDIHSLVKAFFPREDVLVSTEKKETDERISFHIDIEYIENTTEESKAADKTEGDAIRIRFRKEQNAQEMKAPDEKISVTFADRKETKNRLKQKLYDMLSEYTGQKLPWGTLTGIRPTKIPMGMMEEGKSREEIISYMRETYLASQEKIDLSIDVAKRELELLSGIDYENGYSLYIGIPFCPSTCLYCSFTSYPIGKWANRIGEYLDALEKEICFTAEKFRSRHLNTIYIGGGTPTTLEPAQLDRLLTMIEDHFDFSHLLEFTVEAGRPDSITAEKLRMLRKHNISRISINPQTMKQATLDLIGRRHTVEQTVDSFRLARELGFDNINMDIIVGLPEETIEDVKNTMEVLKKLAPDNLTVHSLAVKRAARLQMQKEDYKDLHMENTWDTIALTARYAEEMGLKPYYLYRQKNMAGNFENVGYARPGCAGLYNILIMEEKQTIMALGAGATTKFVFDHGQRIERVGNVKDITHYLTRVDEMIERKQKEMEAINWH